MVGGCLLGGACSGGVPFPGGPAHGGVETPMIIPEKYSNSLFNYILFVIHLSLVERPHPSRP